MRRGQHCRLRRKTGAVCQTASGPHPAPPPAGDLSHLIAEEDASSHNHTLSITRRGRKCEGTPSEALGLAENVREITDHLAVTLENRNHSCAGCKLPFLGVKTGRGENHVALTSMCRSDIINQWLLARPWRWLTAQTKLIGDQSESITNLNSPVGARSAGRLSGRD